MAEAGAFVIVGPQGELIIERGLVRRENSAALDAAGATVTGTPEAERAGRGRHAAHRRSSQSTARNSASA